MQQRTQLESNFKEGDLLYGLQSSRAPFKAQLKQQLGADVGITVDEYNSIFLSRVLDQKMDFKLKTKEQQDFVNCLESKAESIADEKLSLRLDLIKKHYQAICNVSYKKLSLANNDFLPSPKKIDKEQRKLTRMCKASLLNSAITIHFVLDGLDLGDAFNKRYNAYTAAEIRFILKRYHEIEKNIKFYLKGSETTIFSWVTESTSEAKDSLMQWANSRFEKKKICLSTVEKLKTACEAKLAIWSTNTTPPVASFKKFAPPPIKKGCKDGVRACKRKLGL